MQQCTLHSHTHVVHVSILTSTNTDKRYARVYCISMPQPTVSGVYMFGRSCLLFCVVALSHWLRTNIMLLVCHGQLRLCRPWSWFPSYECSFTLIVYCSEVDDHPHQPQVPKYWGLLTMAHIARACRAVHSSPRLSHTHIQLVCETKRACLAYLNT